MSEFLKSIDKFELQFRITNQINHLEELIDQYENKNEQWLLDTLDKLNDVTLHSTTKNKSWFAKIVERLNKLSVKY